MSIASQIIIIDPDIHDSRDVPAFGKSKKVFLLAEYTVKGLSDEPPEYQHGCAYSTSQYRGRNKFDSSKKAPA